MIRAFALSLAACFSIVAADYFPPPDASGGWRRPASGNDPKLDLAFEFTKQTSAHGGLVVAHRGGLIYERYFGRAHHDANVNSASIGKSFTSIAVGILLNERRDLFPAGLDQKIFTPRYFPPEMFPLSDPRKAEIKLGQLLAMTAGIRGNNPGVVDGREVTLDPAGPDGAPAMADEMAFGKRDGPLNTITLWCEPGGGYSYATSSPHLASVMLRQVSGEELEDFVRKRIATPLGWGRWGWGYRNQTLRHTPGGGGIAPRPTDMLRFAYLLMQKGRWGASQIVPRDYVEKCSRLSPYNRHTAYSLQFHVNRSGRWPELPRDLYFKPGSGGHCLYVIPSLELVVFKMGGRDEQYNAANTGVEPAPESSFRYDGSRKGWKNETGISEMEIYRETIRRVVSALEKGR